MKFLLTLLFLVFSSNFAFAGNLIQTNVKELEQVLHEMQHNKLLFLFRSICGCSKQATLSQDLSKDKIVFISLDEKQSDIEDFVKQMKYDVYYIPPTNDNIEKFAKILSIDMNKNESGKIKLPRILLMNENNKILSDHISKNEFRDYLN